MNSLILSLLSVEYFELCFVPVPHKTLLKLATMIESNTSNDMWACGRDRGVHYFFDKKLLLPLT
jgi:hypothetical protein